MYLFNGKENNALRELGVRIYTETGKEEGIREIYLAGTGKKTPFLT